MIKQLLSLASGAAAVAAVLLAPGASPAQTASAVKDLSAGAKPMFLALPPHNVTGRALAPGGSTLAQWNGSFMVGAKTYHFTMVGADPNTSNKTTTIPTVIVPVIMQYGATNGNMTFNPVTHTVAGGNSVIESVMASPLFDATTRYKLGGTTVGTGQYIDVYQRANFWAAVTDHPKYHTPLGAPLVLTAQKIKVKSTQGQVTSVFGATVGTMEINDFDAQIQSFMASFSQINPGVIPIFVTYNIYLTQNGGCCIGGYHSATAGQPGGQTYMVSTYVDSPDAFAQDVAALSHEIGEWQDDPFVDNKTKCGALENGDPLENEPNFGTFVRTLGGFDYHLQDLVFLTYFGAPASTSVNSWKSFLNASLTVCQNGA